MADDIKIKLGLDATELFAGLNKVTAEAQKAVSTIGNTKVDINEAPLVADLNKIETEAKQTGDALNKGLGGGLDGLKEKFSGLSGGSLDLGGSLQSLTGGVTSLVPGLGSLSGILAGGGITAGIAALGGGIAFAIEKGKAFETQLASLSSITGVSGPALDDLGEKAKVMASKFGTEASANIESFKTILSKLGPDIAKSPEALNSMAESVNTLSKATGDDPGKATEALTGALLQFGVSLDDPVKAADAMAVAMNVLAAGAKEGASEVPDVAAAINVAGVAASSAKVSFEETNSAIQVLAAGGKVGAEAGTSLRNVLNKLGEGRFLPKDTAKELAAAGVDINKLGDTTISFSERLRELNKISGDAALKTKLFGTDAAAASILIKGANGEIAGGMDNLTKKLTGTNTAYDQAAINMNTFDESLNRIKSNVDNFAISFYDGMKMSFGMLAESIGPSVNELMGTMSDYFSRMWSVVGPILQFIGAQLMFGISNVLTLITESMNLFYETAVYAFDQVLGALKPLYDAIMSALGLDGAMGQGIDVVKMLQDAMNFASAAISAIFDVLQSLAKILIDVVVFAFSKVISVITTVIETVAAVGRAIFDFVKSLPGVQSALSGLQSAFNAVYGFFSNLPGVINESQAYLKAIGTTFKAVFSVLKQAFDDVLNLDFTSAGAKLASVFDSNNWSQAFGAGLQQARSELKKTGDATRQAGKEFKDFQETTTVVPPPKTDKDGEKKKTEKEKTELQKRQQEFKNFLIKQQNDRNTDFINFKGTEEEKSIALKKRLKDDAAAAQIELNRIARGVADTEFNPIDIKIKPGKGENMENVKSFYIEEFKKLQEDIEKTGVKIKPDLSWREPLTKELADFIKEVEANAKDYAKVAGDLFKQSVNTQGLIDKAEKDFDNITNILTDQQVELTNKINLALSIGDTKAVESLQKLKDSNAKVIAETELRYFRFLTDSKKAMSENTVDMQIVKALQTSILDVFNADRIRKEQETNAKIREERLGALDQEESDLSTSLAKREISFEEYASKMSQIDKSRQDAMEETEIKFGDRIKEALDKTVGSVLQGQAKAITKFVETSFTKTGEEASESTKIIGAAAGQLATQFGALAASGQATLKDFAAASVDIALTALNQMVPIFIAEITGKQFAELGLAGIAAAAGLTIILNGLVMQARASAGFKDGVIDLEGPGTETSDSIPAWLSRGESVITASSTRANKEELAWMNANPGMSIKDYFAMQAPAIRYSVTEDGDLIKEVRKLREETRGLGRQINRNTHVEISGVLKADNNSIKAMIDNDRRRIARRG